MIILDTLSIINDSLIYLVIIIPVMIIAFVLMKKFKIHIPIIGSKAFYTFGMFDEARVLTWHKLQVSDIKVLGKFVTFEYLKESYFIFKETQFRHDKLPASQYNIHEPLPIPITSKDKIDVSGSEMKEAIDSKVVFDLLRFTLSKVESLFVMMIIVNIAVTAIGVYLVYQQGNTIGNLDTLVRQVVKYLFPNSST